MTNADWKVISDLMMVIFVAVNIIYGLFLLYALRRQQGYAELVDKHAERISKTFDSIEGKHRYLHEVMQRSVRASKINLDGLKKELAQELELMGQTSARLRQAKTEAKPEAKTATKTEKKAKPVGGLNLLIRAGVTAKPDPEKEGGSGLKQDHGKPKTRRNPMPEEAWLRKTGMLD